jgi:hypothetical protein
MKDGLFIVYVNNNPFQIHRFEKGQLVQYCKQDDDDDTSFLNTECCVLLTQKIDTLNNSIVRITTYQLNTRRCINTPLYIYDYELKSGFPTETWKYDQDVSVEYIIKYKKILLPNFHTNAKWKKTYYKQGEIVKKEKGRGRVI